MRKIKAQPVCRDVRAFLRHMISEHVAQRLVQQVGGCMQAGGVLGMILQAAFEFVFGTQA